MQVESLHQQIEAMRIAFIADRRRRGDDTNPFLEADRREVAKREVAAKRVHPTVV
jgi:nucleoporin p58/p45